MRAVARTAPALHWQNGSSNGSRYTTHTLLFEHKSPPPSSSKLSAAEVWRKCGCCLAVAVADGALATNHQPGSLCWKANNLRYTTHPLPARLPPCSVPSFVLLPMQRAAVILVCPATKHRSATQLATAAATTTHAVAANCPPAGAGVLCCCQFAVVCTEACSTPARSIAACCWCADNHTSSTAVVMCLHTPLHHAAAIVVTTPAPPLLRTTTPPSTTENAQLRALCSPAHLVEGVVARVDINVV